MRKHWSIACCHVAESRCSQPSRYIGYLNSKLNYFYCKKRCPKNSLCCFENKFTGHDNSWYLFTYFEKTLCGSQYRYTCICKLVMVYEYTLVTSNSLEANDPVKEWVTLSHFHFTTHFTTQYEEYGPITNEMNQTTPPQLRSL